jgi:two-component sensor histidine kinase
MRNSKKTILLVEDEALIALSSKKNLEKYGYNVITIDSGEKAIQLIKKENDELAKFPKSMQTYRKRVLNDIISMDTSHTVVEEFKDKGEIDLILMDIDLGEGMDGTQAAEIILREKDIPIIFLSSHTESEIVEKTEKITSYGYVVKNSSSTVLDASIKMAFKLFNANIKLKKELIEKKELNKEKNKRDIELIIAKKEIKFQNELIHANNELVYQNKEKQKRASELTIANKELVFQNIEKQKRASELTIANKELIFQNKEKQKRASELTIANKELIFQNEEKQKRASELTIANKELIFQKEEKEGLETLLKEVHHRIKNNITTIANLLSMQLESISNPEAISILQDTLARIFSMSVLYDKLLLSDDYSSIPAKKYLENLIDAIVELFQHNLYITTEKQIDQFNLPSKKLFLLGIILNELLTNTLKYAFIGKKSFFINISLTNIENQLTLTIQDNGDGLPESFNINDSNGFGLKLVKMLCEQLNGSFTIENHKGTRSIVKFFL